MATADDVINVAAGEIGYYAPNDPADGSKYGRWLAEYLGESWLAGPSDEVWWCMIFVSWVFYHANQSCPGLPSYNTDTTLEAARSAGIVVPASNMARGDIVIMETDSESPGTDHVGIVETVNSSYYTTIEGNTSSSVYSSNCVARKTRYFDGTIAGVILPPYSGGSTTVPGGGSIAEDGYWGSETTRAFQRHYGTPEDGTVSHQWEPNIRANPVLTTGWLCDETLIGSTVIRAIQRDLGVEADGIMGPNTIGAIYNLFGGAYGYSTTLSTAAVWEIQHQLNGGVWPLHL